MSDELIRLAIVPIPISLTSGTKQFELPQFVMDTPGLYFEIYNPNVFDAALEGTPRTATKPLVASATMGWQIMARERTPVRASKRPITVSVAAIGTSGNPLPDGGFDYSGCFIYLNYMMKGN